MLETDVSSTWFVDDEEVAARPWLWLWWCWWLLWWEWEALAGLRLEASLLLLLLVFRLRLVSEDRTGWKGGLTRPCDEIAVELAILASDEWLLLMWRRLAIWSCMSLLSTLGSKLVSMSLNLLDAACVMFWRWSIRLNMSSDSNFSVFNHNQRYQIKKSKKKHENKKKFFLAKMEQF